MLQTFGWKAAIAVVDQRRRGRAFSSAILCASMPDHASALGAGWRCRHGSSACISPFWPRVVVFSHHPIVFLALFLFFLGFAEAYKRYQSPLILREGLMVGFFLAGLVVLGGQQKWWLQPLLDRHEPDRAVLSAPRC